MSRVKDLIGELADNQRLRPAGGTRMLLSLNNGGHRALTRLAQALDLPSGVLASRLLDRAIQDAEERASDLDLYDRG